MFSVEPTNHRFDTFGPEVIKETHVKCPDLCEFVCPWF